MLIKVTKCITFDAAHYLEVAAWTKKKNKGVFHACAGMHGHTYKCHVNIVGELQTNGFVIDFKVLKAILQEKIMNKFDHKILNDVIPEAWHPVTVENMINYLFMESGIAQSIAKETKRKAYLSGIKIWETPDSFAEVVSYWWKE